MTNTRATIPGRTSDHKWIVVDGPDGSGKTTAIQLLKTNIEATGKKVKVLKAAGSGPNGRVLRRLYLQTPSQSSSEAVRATLSFTMHIQHIVEVKKALEGGYVVLSDRSIASFYAYNVHTLKQPVARSIYEELFCDRELIDITPTVAIYLDSDTEILLNRLQTRNDGNYLDNISINRIEALRDGYSDYYAKHRDRPFIPIWNESTLQNLEGRLARVVDSFIT